MPPKFHIPMTDERFAAVYSRHYASLVRFLSGFAPGADPYDLAQEVFVRLYRKGGAVPDGEVLYWLLRVARNLALNSLRRQRLWDSLRQLMAPLQRSHESPEESMRATEVREAVHSTLAALSPDWRAAILLREWEGLSYDEIAAVLGVPVSKVRSDLFRARQRMRALLRPATTTPIETTAKGAER
jgi:RNA polymerase sigma-70 factor, ECF subfamily